MSNANPSPARAELSIDKTALITEGWSASARLRAADGVLQQGLPQPRDEYWKYTRPQSLTQTTTPSVNHLEEDNGELFADLDVLKLVFVDGIFDAAQSDVAEDESFDLEMLSDVKDVDIHWAGSLYGTLEAKGQTPVPRTLAQYNTAVAEQGILLHVKGEVQRPINLIYKRGTSAQSDALLHHTIKIDAGASVTVLETGPVGARANIVMEVDLGEGASLNHIRSLGRDAERLSVSHVFARLSSQSQLKSFSLTMNGALTRYETVVEINGDDAIAHVAGASVGDRGFHNDDTVFVTHDALRGESRQVFKKVLRNGATGVFQGKILVKDGAQKTDGYQISQALLLDEDSQFLAKPELEIYADDVACSHGSTSGAIDEDALFYLRARGVPHKTATNLLTLAFLAEAVEEIEDAHIAEILVTAIEGWLERRSG